MFGSDIIDAILTCEGPAELTPVSKVYVNIRQGKNNGIDAAGRFSAAKRQLGMIMRFPIWQLSWFGKLSKRLPLSQISN